MHVELPEVPKLGVTFTIQGLDPVVAEALPELRGWMVA